MDEIDPWTPYLRANERVLWQAGVAEDRYRAEASRQRKLGAVIMLAAIAAAVLLARGFLDTLGKPPAGGEDILPNLSGVFAGPIYVAMILTCLVVAFAQILRFRLPRPAAARFAATSDRLLALDAGGALIDQIEGAAIADLEISSKANAHSLVVRRKTGESSQPPFSMRYIDRPTDAKTFIEQTFLETGHEQAD